MYLPPSTLFSIPSFAIGSGNYITFLTDDREEKILFLVDSDWKYWIEGQDEMIIGSPVMKAARATGVTVGCIDFLKFDVKLPHSPSKTVEYTITSKGPVYFSESGDSGGPVAGTDGALVGIIIGGTLGVEVWEAHGSFGVVKLSYVTPWSLIKQRIKENLDCDIELMKRKPRLDRAGIAEVISFKNEDRLSRFNKITYCSIV